MAKKNSKEMRGDDEPMLVKSHDILFNRNGGAEGKLQQAVGETQ